MLFRIQFWFTGRVIVGLLMSILATVTKQSMIGRDKSVDFAGFGASLFCASAERAANGKINGGG
jgi:hypothetical protein